MEELINEGRKFSKIQYKGKLIKEREFHDCTFVNCDFAESDFSNNKFVDCIFDACNLSLVKFKNSTLSNVNFHQSKILGVLFHESQDFLFSVKFESCILDFSSFFGKKMLKANFIKCSLKEVNFTQANLSGSCFDESDLYRTQFNRTDLSKADFTGAYNYSIDPELNKMEKALFSKDGLHGLLDKYKIKIV